MTETVTHPLHPERVWNPETKQWSGEYAEHRIEVHVGHFDRRFVAEHFPLVDKQLAYFAIDVGVMRRFFQYTGTTWVVPELNDAKTHRAMDDLELHLAEARHYRDRISDSAP